jgi:hypothetical protein
MSVHASLRRTTRAAQALLLMALPHGGQLAARRNAWAAMSAGSARTRELREADAAMSAAIGRARRRLAGGRTTTAVGRNGTVAAR